MRGLKKPLTIILILLVVVSSSACMQKEPTPEAIIKEIEDVDKYTYSIKYITISNLSNSTVHYRGGFNYDREEAFWEATVVWSKGEVLYLNETLLGDFIYLSYATERNNKIVQEGEANMTVQEYFEKLKKGSTYIKSPEELKYEMLKGPNLARNPLYSIRDMLQNATNFEIAEGDGVYLVVFNFSKSYESPMPENVTQQMRDYFETMRYVRTIKGTARLWIKDNLPIKGEVEGVEIFQLLIENKTSTRRFSAKFEIEYTYKRPEWVKKVIK